MRNIKFRAWDGETMVYPSHQGHINSGWIISYYETVMQFTGLKDKNGKEIYEWDIVNHAGWVCKVVYGENGCCFSLVTKFGDTDVSVITEAAAKYIEVIGNIYENPELLK